MTSVKYVSERLHQDIVGEKMSGLHEIVVKISTIQFVKSPLK